MSKVERHRNEVIDKILTFSANTYTRAFLDGPHPKTGKPYTNAELQEYLTELEQRVPQSQLKDELIEKILPLLRLSDRNPTKTHVFTNSGSELFSYASRQCSDGSSSTFFRLGPSSAPDSKSICQSSVRTSD
jgi:hypothetical protein